MTGLWRIHDLMSEALEHLLAGRQDHAGAMLALSLQAVHQAAVDGGQWQNA